MTEFCFKILFAIVFGYHIYWLTLNYAATDENRAAWKKIMEDFFLDK